jgi:hypothetical protein
LFTEISNMAQLNSPGVSVTVVDDSFYAPAAPGTVPLIFVATAENKQNSAGTGIAPGTVAANNGQVYLITSQRELSDTFGTPVFQTDANNNPIHAGELNEYGLQAAYSYLGVSNRAYIVRANIDLKQLEASASPPNGPPNNGDWWFDTATTDFGIFEWNANTATANGQIFTVKYPTVITELDQLDQSVVPNPPLSSFGAIGDYAITAASTLNKLWFKKPRTIDGPAGAPKWVAVGSPAWVASRPTVQGSKVVSSTFLVSGQEFIINGLTIPLSNDVRELVDNINSLGTTITAGLVNSRLEIYSTGVAVNGINNVVLTGTGWANTATTIGILPKTYNPPALKISKHTEVPPWKITDTNTSAPTGSVWVKTTSPNAGANWSIKTYYSDQGEWVTRSAPLFENNQSALASLDPTGGGFKLPADSTYVKYNDDEVFPFEADFKVYVRRTTGVTSTTTVSLISTKALKFTLQESVTGSALLTPAIPLLKPIEVALADGAINATANANALATAINNAEDINGKKYDNIIATIDPVSNRVTVTHKLGGEIVFMDDNTISGTNSIETIFEPLPSNNFYKTVSAINGVSTTNTSGEATLTNVSDVNGFYVGMAIDGTGVPLNTYIANIEGTGPYTVTMTNASTFAVSSVNLTGTKFVVTLWTSENDFHQGFIVGSDTPLETDPVDGQLWYSSVIDEVDIMVHDGSDWVGYKTATSPFYSATPNDQTDPKGPIVAASKPTKQSGGNALVTGDIWIDSSDEEKFPQIYTYDATQKKWFYIDNTDQTTENGILFADARLGTSGGTKETDTTAAIPPNGSIPELLASNYLDGDAPDPALYPKGMLLWNLRRSGFNVKKFVHDYVDNNESNPRVIGLDGDPEPQTNYYPHAWISIAANQEDGAGEFGRKSQRRVVIQALQSLVNSNEQIRDDENRIFNLMACPGYPELVGEMVALNYDRRLTAFVVGDTPARLLPNNTSLSNWGTNMNLALEDGDKGLASYDEYLGFFYPWGYTSDNLGNNIVVPPSHMILRTISLSDNVSYPWFAPAGTRRGGITNATSVGYITAEGEFQSVALNTGQRDTLQEICKVNPITFISGSGLVNFGQRTRARNASALDRINVARLVIYLRRQLTQLARPYIFEPNDKITRDEFKGTIESLMLALVGQRALYDFIVVCDHTNNTPDRIDRYELWADVAIEPVKAAEFIYIPVRLKNTGEISGSLAR